VKIYKGKEKINLNTWALAFYLLLAPLDFLPVIPKVSVSHILIFIPIIVCLFYIKNMKIRLDRFFVIPVLYVMMAIVTMFYSYDILDTKQRIVSIGLNISAILILTMLTYNISEIKILKKAMVYSGWLTVLLMLFYSNSSIMGGRITVFINGYYQDPNYLTGFLIFSIVYYFEEYIQNKNIISIIKMSIFMFFVFLTGSRGGTLAMCGSILFYSLIWTKSKRLKPASILVIISSIFIIGIIFILALNMLPSIDVQRYNISYTLNDGGAHRIDIWKSILYNYQNSPTFNKIFGWGAGTIRYFTYNGNVGHNIWIESLMETGIVGVSILFIFYFMYFIKACKMREYVVAASFVGYMIMGMSLSLYSYKPIWNIILLIMILKNFEYKLKNNKRENNQLIIRGVYNEG
jgi:hypothetical protein